MSTAPTRQPPPPPHRPRDPGHRLDLRRRVSREPAAGDLQRREGRQRSSKGIELNLTGEVQQHLGGGRVRCVALGSTDGMVRGMDCLDTGAPVKRAGGQGHAGPRVQPAGRDRSTTAARSRPTSTGPSTASRPPVTDLSTKTEIFETGIKVIDLLTPFVRGGKAGLFGGAGLGKTVILTELIARIASAHGGYSRLRRRRRADPRGQRPLAGNAGSQDRQHRPQRASSRPAWSSAR